MNQPSNAKSPESDCTKLPNGTRVVEPSMKRALGAVAIDVSINIVAAFVAWFVVFNNYGDVTWAWYTATASFVIFPWLYGFLSFRGKTVGTALVGTQIVKHKNGETPGILGFGWCMFFRCTFFVLIPLAIFGFIASLFDGGPGHDPFGSLSQYHISIDPKATREFLASIEDESK